MKVGTSQMPSLGHPRQRLRVATEVGAMLDPVDPGGDRVDQTLPAVGMHEDALVAHVRLVGDHLQFVIGQRRVDRPERLAS